MGPRRTAGTFLRASAFLFLLAPLTFFWPGLRGCLSDILDPRAPVDESSPVYLQAAEIFRASPALAARLGAPVRKESLEGRILEPPPREGSGSAFAFFTASVSGPQGRGKIHATANLVGGRWRFSALSLELPGVSERINLLPPPPRETIPLRAPRGKLYLVPFSEPVTYSLAGLPDYFLHRFGLEVEILPALPLDSSLRDSLDPGAVVAEKLVAAMKKAHPQLVADPDAYLIGITEERMAVHVFGWSASTTLRREGRFAAISTERMQPRAPLEAGNPEIVQVRFRKILLKDVGMLIYKLPLSADPSSVLVETAGGPVTLDLMTEEFLGADGVWRPNLHDSAPSFYITRFPDGRYHWSLGGGGRLPPAEEGIQQFQAHVGNGLFVCQQTDFALTSPFAFTRAYRPQDDFSRAFGIGTNHVFDSFLAGTATSMNLILEDGARIHFERSWPALPFFNPVFESGGGGPFGGAVLRWTGEGFELKRRDGWTLIFPGVQPTRNQQAAPIKIAHPDGRTLLLGRDPRGNLRRVLAPNRNSLEFDYDASERVRRITHSSGRWKEYAYDLKGRLEAVRDSSGESVTYFYDSENQMVTVEIPAGRVFLKNKYDEEGRIIQQTLADGRTFEYDYVVRDGQPVQINVIDPDGFATRILRTSQGILISFPTPRESQPE